MSHWAEYDYIVINHDIDQAFAGGAIDPEGRAAGSANAHWPETFVRELQRQLEK